MTLPPIGASAVLELDDWSRGVEQMLADEGAISEAMQGVVDAVTDASDSLSLLDADVETSVVVDVEDSDLLETDALLEGIEGEHEAEVTTDAPTGDVDTFNMHLGEIVATAGRVVLAVGAIGAATTASLVAIGVKAITEYDDALDSIQVHTGQVIPGARELIEDVYNDGLGESKQQIADVISLATQLGIAQENVGSATQEAFITASNTGQDVNSTLLTMNRLVESGLVGNFEEAGDLLTVGMQQGANLGGDMNTSLANSAGILSDMGFTGQEAMALISTGLQNGYNSAGDLINQLVIVRQRLNDNSDEVKTALGALGQTDEADAYQQGTISGGQFMSGLSDALADVEDPAERLNLQLAIFGPRQGRGLAQDAIDSLGDLGTAFDDIAGKSHEARSIIQNDFDTEVTSTFRRLEGVVVKFLSSDQIDLPGKLDILEQQFGVFIDQLESGSSVGEALEIAIDVPGLADQLNHLESIVGNLVLNLAEFAADVLDALNQHEAATSIRQSVEPMAAGQLQFDLNVATNQDQISGAITTAVQRGVSAEEVEGAITESFNAALSSGDIPLAQQIASAAQGQVGADAQRAAALKEMNIQLDQMQAAYHDLGGDDPNGGLWSEDRTAQIDDLRTQMDALIAQRDALNEKPPIVMDADALAQQAQDAYNTYMETFNADLIHGDFKGAQAIADSFDDPAMQQRVTDAVDGVTESIDAALAQHDFSGALNLAQIIGDADRAQQAISGIFLSNYSQTPGFTPGTGNQAGTGAMQGAAPPKGAGAPAGAGQSPFASINQAINDLTQNAQTKAPMIDQQLQLVSDGTTEINTTAQTALPAAQQIFSEVALQMIEDWTPVLLLFQQTYEAMEALQLGGTPGSGSAHPAAPSRDDGGAVQAGQWYDVNGEAFLSPFDAYAMGAGSSQSLMSGMNLNSGGGGGGDTTNTRNVVMNNHYNIASQAEAASHADRVTDQLRGF